jgi:hypothetical protein
MPCHAGQYTGTTGAFTCTDCDISKMCPVEGMVKTETCYPGFICDLPKMVFPTRLCPAGIVCVQGVFKNNALWDKNNVSTAPVSIQCPSGYYCEEGTTTISPYQLRNKSYFLLFSVCICSLN